MSFAPRTRIERYYRVSGGFLLSVVVVATSIVGSGCRTIRPQAEPETRSGQPVARQTDETPLGNNGHKKGTVDKPGEEVAAIPVEPAHPDHWLSVKRAVDPGTGTWGKGDFDAERNKISVVTKNVAEFTIDTNRIPIDWSRLVIISIDGIAAELRPRDYSPLVFKREGYSSWSVVEP